jgi:hypothetical protein
VRRPGGSRSAQRDVHHQLHRNLSLTDRVLQSTVVLATAAMWEQAMGLLIARRRGPGAGALGEPARRVNSTNLVRMDLNSPSTTLT